MAETAQSRYEKKAIRKLILGFNRNTEPELLEYIESIPNKAGYIKRLIRQDMELQRAGGSGSLADEGR